MDLTVKPALPNIELIELPFLSKEHSLISWYFPANPLYFILAAATEKIETNAILI
jgi:hypothetical protein